MQSQQEVSRKTMIIAKRPPLPNTYRPQSKQLKINRTPSHYQDEKSVMQMGYKDHSSMKLITQDNDNSAITEQQDQNLFESYTPQSDLDMKQIIDSDKTQLMRYKQSIYYGEIINQMRHGLGIMIYRNSSRLYEGQWQSNLKFGKGYQKFSNGSKYIGYYVNGKPEGHGTFLWTNGQLYEGQWINGLKHGSGIWKGARGDSYIGEWKYGKADGYGVHTWINGDRYEGQFKQCLKHGQGSQKFANNDCYIGGYSNGKPSGYGQYTWANGSIFKGYFKNGLRHGNGIWKKGANSDSYEGEYVNDKKSGYGIFTWENGNIYKGNYCDDQRDGYGQMYWTDGTIYKGNWVRGTQHGEGQIKFGVEEQFRKGLFEQNVMVKLIAQVQTDQRVNISMKTQLHTKNFNTDKSTEKFSIKNTNSKNLNSTYLTMNSLNSMNISNQKLNQTGNSLKLKTVSNIGQKRVQINKKLFDASKQKLKIYATSKDKSRSKSHGKNFRTPSNTTNFYVHPIHLGAQKSDKKLNGSINNITKQKTVGLNNQTLERMENSQQQKMSTLNGVNSINNKHRIRRIQTASTKKRPNNDGKQKLYIGIINSLK